MKMLFNFHAHIYQVYDLRKTILLALKEYSSAIGIVLTERFDCNFFNQLVDGYLSFGENLQLSKIDNNCVKVGDRLYLFRGRQYASLEGIEVLSLLAGPLLGEKLHAKNYCKAIVESSGIVAFSWAFGKWRGNRSALIQKLATEFGASNVIMLDSRLRPNLLPLPAAFSSLANCGFKAYVGSDPLPLSKHQEYLAAMGSEFELSEDESKKIDSELLKQLIHEGRKSSPYGKHVGLLEFLSDQIWLRLSP